MTSVEWIYRVTLALGALLAAADLLVHRHAEAGFDGSFAFYAVYGFAACVALVLAAKWLRRAVMRREDYYDH
ncbi:MAG: hypothetical protein AB1452_13590 [Pseudomonadota bacterium]